MAQAETLLKKSLEEYIYEHLQAKAERYREYNDMVSYAPSTELLKERKIENCLQMILRKKREELVQKREEFSERWELAREKQEKVQQSLFKFNQYFLDCRTKRDRSIRLASLEKEQCVRKELAINKMTKERHCLALVRAKQVARLEEFQIFEDYLEKVKGASNNDYLEIKAIVDRYSTLAKARSMLLEKNDRSYDQLESRRRHLKNLAEIKGTELVIFSNYLSELRDFQDLVNAEVLRLEELLLHLKTTTANRTVQLGQIRMATYNLYLQVCTQMDRTPTIKADDTLRQLSYIRLSMKELLKLSKEVRFMLKKIRQNLESEKKVRVVRSERDVKKKVKEQPKSPAGKSNAQNQREILALFGFPVPPSEGVSPVDSKPTKVPPQKKNEAKS